MLWKTSFGFIWDISNFLKVCKSWVWAQIRRIKLLLWGGYVFRISFFSTTLHSRSLPIKTLFYTFCRRKRFECIKRERCKHRAEDMNRKKFKQSLGMNCVSPFREFKVNVHKLYTVHHTNTVWSLDISIPISLFYKVVK